MNFDTNIFIFNQTTTSDINNARENKITARKFVVFEEEEEGDCDESSSISTLTFLNFVLSSLSIAASASSNTNSNANANNDNNNNNNLNDNNLNVGNNNNNVNSENKLTFQPMVGKRKRRYLGQSDILLCRYDKENSWMSKTVFEAFDFFARLETCKKTNLKKVNSNKNRKKFQKCLVQTVSEEKERLQNIKLGEKKVLSYRLICGALKTSLDVNNYNDLDCSLKSYRFL